MAIVRIKSGHAKPVWAGHPWVFAQAIAAVEGSPEAGELVSVIDAKGRFLGHGFYSPRSAIPVRVLTRRPDEPVDGAFFRGAIERAARWRTERLGLPSEQTNGFRLVNAEGDGLPGLIVDRFGDALAVTFLTIGMKRREPEILDALASVVGPKAIFEVPSERFQAIEGFEAKARRISGAERESWSIVERGLSFAVTLPGGQKTGFYFDQRENRAVVESVARGAAVLDLYTYHGAFGLAAARGGAKSVVAVDTSPAAVARAAINAEANGVADRVQTVREDARRFLAQIQGRPFDLVVADPPKFAHRGRDREAAADAYIDLNMAAIKVVAPGGLLATCSCSQLVGAEEFLRLVATGARKAGRDVTVLRLLGAGPDHPTPPAFVEGRYLKFALLRVE